MPLASARPVAAVTTASMLSAGRGPCRGMAAASRHRSARVRAGSPAPVRSAGITTSRRRSSQAFFPQAFFVQCTVYCVQSWIQVGRCDVQITASAVSLNVEDVAASRGFLIDHFGFHEELAADGFSSLARDDAGMNVVFLRRGLATLPADQRHDRASGTILAFVVDDLERELTRLRAEGA